jgi:hypothetical protein
MSTMPLSISRGTEVSEKLFNLRERVIRDCMGRAGFKYIERDVGLNAGVVTNYLNSVSEEKRLEFKKLFGYGISTTKEIDAFLRKFGPPQPVDGNIAVYNALSADRKVEYDLALGGPEGCVATSRDAPQLAELQEILTQATTRELATLSDPTYIARWNRCMAGKGFVSLNGPVTAFESILERSKNEVSTAIQHDERIIATADYLCALNEA